MSKPSPTYDPNLVEVKSKFECEFRRFSVDRNQTNQFEAFYILVKESHHLPSEMQFTISYTDPRNGDLLPITNDDNLNRAFTTAIPLLRLLIYRKQDLMLQDMNKKKQKNRPVNMISAPIDFRVVSSIVDADFLPDTVRRVKLLKHSSDRPLGFYIRDGMSVRVTPYGLEKVPGIFISRLVPGGLAEGTGLLAVNDEILEVNAIEVLGKSLDQVTDMMVANSQNLIITVKPASQPPSTPRVGTQTRKPPASKSTGASLGAPNVNKSIGSVGAKSVGDLPSMSATPSSHDKLAPIPNSNGQSERSKSREYEDPSLKRHSIPGLLDSS